MFTHTPCCVYRNHQTIETTVDTALELKKTLKKRKRSGAEKTKPPVSAPKRKAWDSTWAPKGKTWDGASGKW